MPSKLAKKSLYSLLKETYGSKLPPNFTHGKWTKTTPFAKKTMDSNSGSPDLMLHGGPRHNELLPSLDPGASFLSNGDTKKSWHEPWVIPDRFRFLDPDSADGSLYALEGICSYKPQRHNFWDLESKLWWFRNITGYIQNLGLNLGWHLLNEPLPPKRKCERNYRVQVVLLAANVWNSLNVKV